MRLSGNVSTKKTNIFIPKKGLVMMYPQKRIVSSAAVKTGVVPPFVYLSAVGYKLTIIFLQVLTATNIPMYNPAKDHQFKNGVEPNIKNLAL